MFTTHEGEYADLLKLSINMNGNHRIRHSVRHSDRRATIGLHDDRFASASALLEIARDHITVLTLGQTCLQPLIERTIVVVDGDEGYDRQSSLSPACCVHEDALPLFPREKAI